MAWKADKPGITSYIVERKQLHDCYTIPFFNGKTKSGHLN